MTHIDTPQSLCRFGLARCEVTPPAGIYHRMWGAATHERATGVHRPLQAAALVFRPAAEDAGEELILIALDACLFWAREMHGVLDAVSRQADVPAERLRFAFSHTHAAGMMDRGREHLPGGELIGPYLDDLAGRLAAVVRLARDGVRPAVITYGTGRCALAAHRDFWDEASGQYVCGLNPDGPADDTVLVARVTDAGGRLLATVVNYACHPTTLAWENTLISPDYPGAMRETVEQATGAPCVFLQGASGDLGPREGFVGNVAVADRNGRQLGYAALATLEALPPPGTRFAYQGPVVSGATIGTWAHVPLDEASREQQSLWRLRRWTVDLPYRPDLPDREQTSKEREVWRTSEEQARAAGDASRARDCRAMVERLDRRLTRLRDLPPGPAFPLPVTLLQIGDAFWLTVEAEHYQILQTALRDRCPGRPLIVATLANGSRCAYLPRADAYGKGIYQETIAVLAAGCLEELIDEVGRQLGAWAIPGGA